MKLCAVADTPMSRIWDALKKVEKLRDVEGLPPDSIPEILQDSIRLTPKQRVAIQALLRTPTMADAAAAAGVNEMTLRRWLGKPGFVAAYYEAGRAEIDEAMRRLDSATDTAVAVLAQARELLTSVRARADRALAANGRAPADDTIAPSSAMSGEDLTTD